MAGQAERPYGDSADERPGIFLSYRRDDSAGFAGRLYDDLVERLPKVRIFMDVDTIQPGEDFVDAIERAVTHSGVVLALIGPRWMDATDASGDRRIDNELDYVRLEIEGGLRSGKRVIPVLVQGTSMPRAGDLPESLRPLARRHAVELSHSRWRSDLATLLETIGEPPVAAPATPAAPVSPRVEAAGGAAGQSVRRVGPSLRRPAAFRLPVSALVGALVLLLALLGGGALVGALATAQASPTAALSPGPSLEPSPAATGSMSAFGVPCTVMGTEANDEGTGLRGTAGDDVICGLGGNDLIVGMGGDDLIDGGPGEDRVTYAEAPSGVVVDLVTGIVTGGDGNDRLTSVEGVMDSSFADDITGTTGRNGFWLHGGVDVVDGGEGLDSVDYAYAQIGACADDTLTGIEEVYPTGACDPAGWESPSPSPGTSVSKPPPTRTPRPPTPRPTTPKPPPTKTPTPPTPTPNPAPMSGFGVPCTIWGTPGNDEGSGIQGTAGDDVICGRGGNDLIVGKGGADRIDGGGGTDRVTYSGAPGGVSVNLATGVVTGAWGADQLLSIEGIMDSTHDDTLVGSSSNDYFWLHGGVDHIDGGGGTDVADYTFGGGECADDVLISIEETYPTGECP